MKKIILVLCFLSLGILSGSTLARSPNYQFCLKNSVTNVSFLAISAKIYYKSFLGKTYVGEIRDVNNYSFKSACITFSNANKTLSKLTNSAYEVIYELSANFNSSFKPTTCHISYPNRWGIPGNTTAIVTASDDWEDLECQMQTSFGM